MVIIVSNDGMKKKSFKPKQVLIEVVGLIYKDAAYTMWIFGII